MGAKKEPDSIDASKLSILSLLARVRIGQLAIALTAIIGSSFGIGQWYANLDANPKNESDERPTEIRSEDLEGAREQIASLRVELAACQAEQLKSAIIPPGDATPLQPTPPGTTEAYQLPTRQWLAVETSLPIIDGKVDVVVQRIRFSNGKEDARISIRIPMRKKPFARTLKRTGVMEFDYQQRTYKLTANDIDLQNQRVQITIIEM